MKTKIQLFMFRGFNGPMEIKLGLRTVYNNKESVKNPPLRDESEKSSLPPPLWD
jgi:hypothetical protein